MGKMKNISLSHKGYKFTGTAMVELWGGGIGEVAMDPFFLTSEQLTHTNIKRSINDGRFGCQRIISAAVQIYDVYGSMEYTQFNRKIDLNQKQCQEAFKGVTV